MDGWLSHPAGGLRWELEESRGPLVLTPKVMLGGKFSPSVCVLRLEALYQCESGLWESNGRNFVVSRISYSHGGFSGNAGSGDN